MISVTKKSILERDKEDEQKARRCSQSYIEHFLRNPTQSQPKRRFCSRISSCYALSISAAVHLGVIGLVIWGASFFRGVEFGGKGNGIVDVWISGTGEGAAVSLRGRKAEAISLLKPRLPRSPLGLARNDTASASRDNTGSGEGIGSGQGSGLGSGTGGDPALAEIWKRINRSKYYPEIAKRSRMTGIPKVTFEISSDGQIKNIALSNSCGEKMLDDAAIETVKRAAPLPFFSSPITIAVEYSLK